MEKNNGNVGKYRPRKDVIRRVLLKRFCARCREMTLEGRLHALRKGSRCFKCSVFRCLEIVDPKLEKLKKESEWIRKVVDDAKAKMEVLKTDGK